MLSPISSEPETAMPALPQSSLDDMSFPDSPESLYHFDQGIQTVVEQSGPINEQDQNENARAKFVRKGGPQNEKWQNTMSWRSSGRSSRYYSTASFASSVPSFHSARSRDAAISREIAGKLTQDGLEPRSSWQRTLANKNLLQPKFDETDWSGRGQHAEFSLSETSLIDTILIPKGILGHSANAVVEKVRCRRIMLARKTIKCNWRLKREDAIDEVAHLQRLVHAHVVRCVGTYVHGNKLSILMYPATNHNLETLMDHFIEMRTSNGLSSFLTHPTRSILHAYHCLVDVVAYIHSKFVKHMDIKPSNILVRYCPDTAGQPVHIYLTDFGIARSYKDLDEAETDSRTAYSKAYAAPEVILREKRGFSADIFSLGCVFLEMLYVLLRERRRASEIRNAVLKSCGSRENGIPDLTKCELFSPKRREKLPYDMFFSVWSEWIQQMVAFKPYDRPDARHFVLRLGRPPSCCEQGPTPFQVDEELRPPVPPKDSMPPRTCGLENIQSETESWDQFVKSIIHDELSPSQVEPLDLSWLN